MYTRTSCHKSSFSRTTNSAGILSLVATLPSRVNYALLQSLATCPFPTERPSNSTQVTGIDAVSFITSRLVDASTRLVYYLTSGKETCMWSVSFSMSSGRPSKRDVRTYHNDQPLPPTSYRTWPLFYGAETVCGVYSVSKWPILPPFSEHEGPSCHVYSRVPLVPTFSQPRTCIPFCPLPLTFYSLLVT